MTITFSELEAIIPQTLPGEQVQYEGKPIGSVDQNDKCVFNIISRICDVVRDIHD